MKTERRHELQTNDLADWLGQKTAHVKPYWKSIAAGAILLFGGGVIYLFFVSVQMANARQGWQAYFKAASEGNAAQLEGVGQENAGSQPGLWATLSAADLKLSRASFDLTRNREEATKPLEEAIELYNRVLDRVADQPMLRRRALFGLAQAYECLSVADGRLSKNKEYLDLSKKTYERLIADGKDSVLGQEAGARLETLVALAGSNADENFYWWYANQKPVAPGAGAGAGSGLGGTGLGGTGLGGTGLGGTGLGGTGLGGSGAGGGTGLNIPGLNDPSSLLRGGTDSDPGSDPAAATDPNAPKPFPGSPPAPEPEAPATDPDEPAKPEPAKPEPAKPEPAKPEPAKPEPAKPEPAKPEPAKPEPAKPEPEPAKPEPAKPATDPPS